MAAAGMIFAEVPVRESAGALLGHAVMIGGRRRAKGSVMTDALVAAAQADGLTRLWIARAEDGDVAETEAAIRIGAQLSGAGVIAEPPVHGKVSLRAAVSGLFLLDAGALNRANAVAEDVAIATLAGDQPVAAGTLLATAKILPFFLAGHVLDHVLAAVPPLLVQGWQPGLRARLLQSRLPHTAPALLDKTTAITAARLQRLGVALQPVHPVDHAVPALAAAIRAADDGRHWLLLAGASATADRGDVLPAAIVESGGRVLRFGMPVDPGNLMVLGESANGVPIIGLPGCARSPRRNGLDQVLERLAAGMAVDAAAVTALGVGGLLEESGRRHPWGWDGA